MNRTNFECYVGTSVKVGNEKRLLLDRCIRQLTQRNYTEIEIPIIQYQQIFKDKIGDNKNLMFLFEDRGDRQVCLAPEYTAVVQNLTQVLKEPDLKLFYLAPCFRHEKPQYLRYRQFTQLGVEILNPTRDYTADLISLAQNIIGIAITPCDKKWYESIIKTIMVDKDAVRGLDYYVDPQTKLPIGKGFEIRCSILGTAAQIGGGGSYQGGQGFAIGVERLLELNNLINNFDIFAPCERQNLSIAVVQ